MPASKLSATACRPREQLLDLGRSYPKAWKTCEAYRAGRGTTQPAWPDWCYVPLPVAYLVVSDGQDVALLPSQAADVGRLGALAAWRMTQGIYRFDLVVFDAIAQTHVTGTLPHETLLLMPEWCVYVETPGLRHGSAALHGFYAHLDHALDTGAAELRLLLDGEGGLDPVALPLGAWSLAQSIAHAAADGADAAAEPVPGEQAVLLALVEPLVSLLLYLCSQAAEIVDGTRHPGNPQPKKTRRGLRLFQAEKASTWDVGVRLGAALRRAYQAEQACVASDGVQPSLRPHVRRAHWHGFWIGPLEGPRRFALRWLPPIAVNLDSPDALPATVRRVE